MEAIIGLKRHFFEHDAQNQSLPEIMAHGKGIIERSSRMMSLPRTKVVVGIVITTKKKGAGLNSSTSHSIN